MDDIMMMGIWWARSSNHFRHIGRTLLCQKVGNKSHPQKCVAYHFSECSWGPAIWRVLRYSFLGEGDVAACGPSWHRKRSTMPGEPLRILESTYTSFGNTAVTHVLKNLKNHHFWLGSRIKESSITYSGWYGGAWSVSGR